ncbi:carboxylate--amine ligase [Varibaculum vaginae]|uniref:carboxylate--amine ligase n=1 Tax=Varibaculum vaginae TaxID=2364797 RepID=UPI000F08F0E3|nr:carboxylate--amine ligase [Varibaculum vaginae]
MKQFQPVILGSDINAYGMARAFHEAYGKKSIAFAHFQLSPTKYSKIIDVRIVQNFGQLETFKQTLLQFAKIWYAEHPQVKLLLISCGDAYANLLSECGDELKEHFSYHTLPLDLNRRLSLKSSFYQLCEEYGLPYPATKVLNATQVKAGEYQQLPFDFPIAMKPANSTEWLDIDFPGRKKAFIIDTPQELDTLITRSYDAGYTGEMILQDFIPGDDSRMRVLNAYVDRNHQVRMMFLGHPLLEDPTPEAVGNYAAIIPDYNQEICQQIKAFLEDIKYVGFANFDMKYDERDGKLKLFEINLRQGRSSYFVTLNGFNLGRYFVEDLIEQTDFNGETIIGRGNKLWMEIPRRIFQDYVAEGAEKQRGMEMIARGDWGTTLEYHKDRNLLRWAMIRHMFSIYSKRYAQHFRNKS